MASVEVSKMGLKGLVVVPQPVRELLGIDKGSNVAFVITDDNRVEIRPLEANSVMAANEFEAVLKENGMTLGQWAKEGKKIRRKLLKDMFDIDTNNPSANA